MGIDIWREEKADIMQTIFKVHYDDPRDSAFFDSIGKQIYHYTSAEGLNGIMQDHLSLFFTRYDCLNDASEGQIIRELYQEALKQYSETHPEQANFCQQIQNVDFAYHTFLPDDGKLVRDEKNKKESWYAEAHRSTPYVCCFSLDSDSLAMWRYYSKGSGCEGYSIGFNDIELPEPRRLFRKVPVVYEHEYQIIMLKEHIELAYRNYTLDETKNIKFAQYEISRKLLEASLQFKKNAFRHEKEYRVIFDMPDDYQEYAKKYPVKQPEWIHVKYRTTKGVLIPYIDIPITPSRIDSITVGPFQLKDLAAKTLRQYLNEKEEYRHIKIQSSNIPIRF